MAAADAGTGEKGAADSDVLTQTVLYAQCQTTTSAELLQQLSDAVRVHGKCASELPCLQAWEAAPPDIGALEEAQFDVDEKLIELRTARDRLSTATRQKRAEGKLAELQAVVEAAKSSKRDAESALNALQDEALGSIAHYVELASVVVAGDVPEELMSLWQPHRQLSDFTYEELPGGRHRVYKIECGNDSEAVMKEYPCVGDQRKYFFREVLALHALQHPCVMEVQAIFIDSERNSFFVQMPFCSGGDLDAYIRSQVSIGVMDGSSARLLLQRVLRGVEFLHAKGILHADLKPANILVDTQGFPRLADFETSRSGATATSMSCVLGTKGFIAPELRDGDDPTMQSDMFALGKTLEKARAAMEGLSGDVAGLGELESLAALLTKEDSTARPTAAQALQHAYFTTHAAQAEARLLSKAEADANAAAQARQEVGDKLQAVDAEKIKLQDQADELARLRAEADDRIRGEREKVGADAQRNQDMVLDLKAKRGKLADEELAVRGRRLEVEQQRAALVSQEANNAQLRQLQQYEWLDENGAWIPYSSTINQAIAVASSTAATHDFMADGRGYSVATQFPMFQTSKQYNTHRHVRLADGSAVEAHLRQAPTYWRAGTSATASELVVLDRRNLDMQAAWDDVEARVKLTVPGVRVLEVSVLQDPLRWRAYNTKKGNLERKLAGGANERRVFHAGCEASVSNIAKCGFLREYNRTSVWGKGTYFAKDASYSVADKYSKPNAQGEKFMFLARALIGEPCIGGGGMMQPTTKPGSAELHDSMVNRIQDPSIMVLSAGSDEHAYAEFLVKFKL
jgi:poly [ADP-ribose] polymerase 10/14/15